MTSSSVLVEISVGELLDKISILEIKLVRIKDSAKIKHIQKELEQLTQIKNQLHFNDKRISEIYIKLKQVNEILWRIEDELRDHERKHDFGVDFIELARKVYFKNDLRSALKKQINQLTNSNLHEEKSYQEY
jgi:hypothetical protein